jgi:hypothetical protein
LFATRPRPGSLDQRVERAAGSRRSKDQILQSESACEDGRECGVH